MIYVRWNINGLNYSANFPQCKDCKYWDDDIDGYCVLKDSFNWNANDFCSRGEKKDE